MGSDQQAAIRPALRELRDALENDEPGAEGLCATFTLPESQDAWAQVMGRTINLYYPRAEEPLLFLNAAGGLALPGLQVDSWRANTFATFVHDPASVDAVARFVDRLLIVLHNLDVEDYSIDVGLEWL